MSFSNNCKSDKIPGPIRGNGLSGICERACIQCDKVIDMCMRQETLTDLTVALTDVTPSTGLVQPYTFVSASATSTQATISDLIVTPLKDDPCFSRVQCTITVPIQVQFTDANGTRAFGSGTVSVSRDVVLHTSAPSVILSLRPLRFTALWVITSATIRLILRLALLRYSKLLCRFICLFPATVTATYRLVMNTMSRYATACSTCRYIRKSAAWIPDASAISTATEINMRYKGSMTYYLYIC